MSHVTHMNESGCTHICASHDTHVRRSCMSTTSRHSHVSRHTNKLRHVTHTKLRHTTHINYVTSHTQITSRHTHKPTQATETPIDAVPKTRCDHQSFIASLHVDARELRAFEAR